MGFAGGWLAAKCDVVLCMHEPAGGWAPPERWNETGHTPKLRAHLPAAAWPRALACDADSHTISCALPPQPLPPSSRLPPRSAAMHRLLASAAVAGSAASHLLGGLGGLGGGGAPATAAPPLRLSEPLGGYLAALGAQQPGGWGPAGGCAPQGRGPAGRGAPRLGLGGCSTA